MKKILSLILVVAVIASALSLFSLNASAASGKTLKITCQGQVLGEVEVGNEFIYHVALDSAGYSPNGADGELRYDPNFVQVVEYGPVKSSGAINMDGYSFPQNIRNTSLMTNYYALSGTQVAYNFAKANAGVGVFTTDDHYLRVRFKAIASGTVEMRHYMRVLTVWSNNKYLKLITNDKGNDQLNPIPFTVSSIEPASAYIGDADGDYNLSIVDATYIQRIAAGADLTYNEKNADVDKNGEVNLRDALNVLRYKAGITTQTDIGKWVFDSEEEV